MGKSVEEVGKMRGQDPLDAFLDLALEEDLETTFVNYNSGGDARAMAEILRSPYILVGNSDAGAKVQISAENGYCTTFLGLWVREKGVMSLEQAIHKLTSWWPPCTDSKAEDCCAPDIRPISRSLMPIRLTPERWNGSMISRPTRIG